MNLVEKFTIKEIQLLNNIGINIESKNYSTEEIKSYEREIEEFIFSHSSKNGDIAKFSNEYGDILNTIMRCQ